jgi:hypothetical protein
MMRDTHQQSANCHAPRQIPRHAFVRSCLCAAASMLLMLQYGCAVSQKKTFSADRPSRQSVKTEHFVIKTDIDLNSDDPLVEELESLQARIKTELKLPPQRDPVVVYLFSDEITYRYYMQTTWNNLPPRRAYFVGTSRELAVYSFRSPRIQEDLRHEFTHGILHACLNNVPLWLDEGLAEYFEVGGKTSGAPHREHVLELLAAREEGWNPNLFRLEVINDFRKLTQRDYAESWAWVHFMLHSEPEARQVLEEYIAGLTSTSTPRTLRPSLEKVFPQYYSQFVSHTEQLQAQVAIAAARSLPPDQKL